MRKRLIFGALLAAMALCFALAQAETLPVTGEEIRALVDRMDGLTRGTAPLNDPAAEDAAAEDGYAFQYDFGVVYADQPAWTETTGINAFFVMDEEITGPREIGINWTVNRVMEEIPCDNPEMQGNYEEALLYLEGDAGSGFRYGRVERDGQRISAMEYGVVDPGAETRLALILGISGDGVDYLRVEGMNERWDAEMAAELYGELQEIGKANAYVRVPRSLVGTDLEMFQEADLYFSAISYLTAEPAMFGENVEDMLIEDEDGTWLRRVDGEGFEAVFSCDSQGQNAVMLSYSILSQDLEGPRCVRLGDLFHEDFTRFRSGEGEMSEDGQTEVLYGTVGTAPYGLAEYGDGTEMTLRYVTPTLSGPEVEMILRYRDTALAEIILHTMSGQE